MGADTFKAVQEAESTEAVGYLPSTVRPLALVAVNDFEPKASVETCIFFTCTSLAGTW